MRAPSITAIRHATMEPDKADRYTPSPRYLGVPALLQIGDNVFTSQQPTCAGHAETINRDIRDLVANSRKAP